jgi:hypothetical protein
MTNDKFDPNLVLVNINKPKPYQFIEDHTLQLVLAKPDDLLPKKPIEIGQSNNPFIKEPVEIDKSFNSFI